MSSTLDDRAVVRAYRVWKTVHQLVHDRGYAIAAEELELTIDQFRATYCSSVDGKLDKAKLTFFARGRESSGLGQIYVAFAQDPTVGIKEMRNFVDNLTLNHHKVGILIYERSMSPASNKIIAALAARFQIDTFQEADLVVNITHHELVPRHIILDREEKQELLLKYKLKETQLPRIQVADPVARYYGLRRGQVVKIIRKSETAGRYSSYRICAG
ncbi:DNA-directed RNA polymerases II 24 kDa polypeptide (RNA polymerase II subunit 5) [Savitreella phatthalungensis]